VLYKYADPELEALSSGQKMLLRIGPENAAHPRDQAHRVPRGARRAVARRPAPTRPARRNKDCNGFFSDSSAPGRGLRSRGAPPSGGRRCWRPRCWWRSLGAFAPRFQLDASSETLVMEHDEAVRFYRAVRARYESDDFLIVTYTPDGGLFTEPALDRLAELRDALLAIDQVEAVTTLLDVPILDGLDVSLTDLPTDPDELDLRRPGPGQDCRRAVDSDLYRNLLVSPDGAPAASGWTWQDEDFRALQSARDQLRIKDQAEGLMPARRRELAELDQRIAERAPSPATRRRGDRRGARGARGLPRRGRDPPRRRADDRGGLDRLHPRRPGELRRRRRRVHRPHPVHLVPPPALGGAPGGDLRGHRASPCSACSACSAGP
jgi:hypothetical protein